MEICEGGGRQFIRQKLYQRSEMKCFGEMLLYTTAQIHALSNYPIELTSLIIVLYFDNLQPGQNGQLLLISNQMNFRDGMLVNSFKNKLFA